MVVQGFRRSPRILRLIAPRCKVRSVSYAAYGGGAAWRLRDCRQDSALSVGPRSSHAGGKKKEKKKGGEKEARKYIKITCCVKREMRSRGWVLGQVTLMVGSEES